MFIAKAYEDKVVNDSTIMRDAVANAVGNIFRKKGKGVVQLWKHREKVDKEAKKKDAHGNEYIYPYYYMLTAY